MKQFNKLTNEEMKAIKGGYDYISQCSIQCPGGHYWTYDCGAGTSCVSDSPRQSVWCGSVEHCGCEVV
jgi:bacteriocin-like protein